MAAPDERGEMPLIGRLTIEDGHLIYRNPAVGLDIDGRISSAEGTGGDKGQSQLTFKGEGRLQGEAFRANVTGGSLLTLREGEKPYPVRVDIEAASSHLLISGTLEDPVQVEGLDLRIALEGPDLSRLTRITGVPLPMTPTYKLSGVLERDGQRWAVRGLDGEMGHSDLSGDVFYDATGERTKVEADLHSKVLDYRDVGPLIGLEAQREEGDGEAEKKDPAAPPPKVLPTAPLSIEQVRNIEADVRFKGDKVEAPNVPLDGVEMALTIDDGVLTLKPITVGVAGGTTEAVIKVDARKEPVVTDYNIRLKNYALEDFFAAAGLEGKAKGRIDGRIRLKGTGNTVAESLGSAGGDIRLVMEEGEVSNLGLELAGLDLAQSLGVLAQGDAPVPIRCFVADFNVDDGAVWPRVFVFDTTDTTLTADGGLNFKDESLNLRLSAHPKDSSLAALRSPITVKGSFSRPDLGVEKAPLVARAGAALALGALLTPLAAILAFIDPSLQKDSDCGALLQDYPVSK